VRSILKSSLVIVSAILLVFLMFFDKNSIIYK
jgi:hypothetical protein